MSQCSMTGTESERSVTWTSTEKEPKVNWMEVSTDESTDEPGGMTKMKVRMNVRNQSINDPRLT